MDLFMPSDIYSDPLLANWDYFIPPHSVSVHEEHGQACKQEKEKTSMSDWSFTPTNISTSPQSTTARMEKVKVDHVLSAIHVILTSNRIYAQPIIEKSQTDLDFVYLRHL